MATGVAGDADARPEVADDRVGGARLDRDSGVRGLSERVAALDGRLELDTPLGGGTRLRAAMA